MIKSTRLAHYALRLLLLIGVLAGGSGSVLAEEVTFSIDNDDSSLKLNSVSSTSTDNPDELTYGPLTITFTGLGSSKSVNYDSGSNSLKFQTDSYFTLQGTNVYITKVVVNHGKKNKTFSTDAEGFTIVYDSNTDPYPQTYTSEDGVDATSGLTFTASSGNVYVSSIEVTYIPASTDFAFSPSSASIEIGSTYTTTLVNVPSESPTITYASDDTSIATVSESGVVTGVAAGTTNITASYTDTDEEETTYNATLAVTVTKKTPSLTFANDAVSITLGGNYSVGSTYTNELTNSNNVDVTYSSYNETVATVGTYDGSVTILAAGETTITATSAETDTYSSGSASYTLTIVDPTSDKVQEYDNTYTWDFDTSNEAWEESSISQLNSFSDLWTASEEGVQAWTLTAPTEATGYAVDIIEGLRFSTTTSGTVTLNYTSGYLTVSSGVTLTVPEVTGGWKVMINYSDGTTEIKQNTESSDADVEVTFAEGKSITSITVKNGDLTWNYQTISEVAGSRNESYLAYLLEDGSVTAGAEDEKVPGITFTIGETTSTWSAAAGAPQTITTATSKTYKGSYALSSDAVATVDVETDEDDANGIPTAGTFYKFTADVSGVLTLYADCYNTSSKEVVSTPTGYVYVKKEGTAAKDFVGKTQSLALDESASGLSFVVLQDSTYYVYCTGGDNEVLRLYGFDFEPSYIYGGKAIPNNTKLTENLKVGADYEFPFFATANANVTYGLSPVSDTDGVSINSYGEVTLEKTTGFDGKTPYTVSSNFTLESTTAFGSVKDTLRYIIPGIDNNENIYVLDTDDRLAIGKKITSVTGITMTYGGWNMNNDSTYYNDSRSKELTDKWGNPKSDDASQYGTFGGLSLATSGAQNGKSETYGNTSETYGSIDGNFVADNKNSLPVRGAYATFEPTQNGTLGIYILQNGCINIFGDDKSKTSDAGWYSDESSDFNGVVSWRPFYIVDETGSIVDGVTGKAKAKLKWTEADLNALASEQGEDFVVYYGTNNEMSEPRRAYLKSLLVTANKGTAVINQVDDATTDSYGGWLAPMKSYVYYKVPVISGKTYYIFSNSSKLGMCGFEFVPTTVDENTLTLENTNTEVTVPDEGYYSSATISRTFVKDTWSTICLPFSTSKSQLAAAINEDWVEGEDSITVQLLEYWGVRNNKIELVNHVNNDNIVAGVPYLVKFSAAVSDITISTPVYVSTTEAGSVSGTDHILESLRSSYDPDYTWKGVFTSESIDGNDWFLSGGNFVHTGADSDIDSYSYRCFLQCNPAEETAKQLLGMYYESAASDDQSVTDGIVAISFDEVDSSVISNVSAGVYNLSGQKVADTIDAVNALPAGIYISGGKKMVIK